MNPPTPTRERMMELLRAFADDEPLYGSEYDGDTCCLYCAYSDHGHYDIGAGRWVSDASRLERHASDCLWRRACVLLGIVPQDPEPAVPAPAPSVHIFLADAWQEQLRRALQISLSEMRRRELWQVLPPEEGD